VNQGGKEDFIRAAEEERADKEKLRMHEIMRIYFRIHSLLGMWL
jgi:hypothetical protein